MSLFFQGQHHQENANLSLCQWKSKASASRLCQRRVSVTLAVCFWFMLAGSRYKLQTCTISPHVWRLPRTSLLRVSSKLNLPRCFGSEVLAQISHTVFPLSWPCEICFVVSDPGRFPFSMLHCRHFITTNLVPCNCSCPETLCSMVLFSDKWFFLQ